MKIMQNLDEHDLNEAYEGYNNNLNSMKVVVR